jgi:hypothetical protein
MANKGQQVLVTQRLVAIFVVWVAVAAAKDNILVVLVCSNLSVVKIREPQYPRY